MREVNSGVLPVLLRDHIPHAIGERIGLLASGRSPFITGQPIDFTDGRT